MAVRHSGLHLARDVGQGFSGEILGAHTYTWSFVIFWCCAVAISLLLLMARPEDVAGNRNRPARGLESAAYIVFLVVIAANIVQAFASTGPPPFVGQSDPIRFSFNPRDWVWSLGEFEPAPISLRGRWAIEKPDVARADPDPGSGPFQNLPVLPVGERRRVQLSLRGTPTGLDYDPATDRFLLTTQNGVYVTDGALTRIERGTVVDPMYSVDLARFGAAAFLDGRTSVAISENKSFVVLRERAEGGTDAAATNFRFFLESPGSFDEVSRSRFATVRAKMFYVMSAAFDPATRSLYTLTVPNARTRRLVVSRFDTRDMTLSEEFLAAPAPGVVFGPKPDAAGMERLYVTGAAFADGRLYALSAAHGTLLTIDPTARAVTAAHTIAGLSQPTGLAFKGDQAYIVSADGSLTIARRP
jgi:disulfide bond formation protein DsbB